MENISTTLEKQIITKLVQSCSRRCIAFTITINKEKVACLLASRIELHNSSPAKVLTIENNIYQCFKQIKVAGELKGKSTVRPNVSQAAVDIIQQSCISAVNRKPLRMEILIRHNSDDA